MKRLLPAFIACCCVYAGFTQQITIAHQYYTIHFDKSKKLPVYTFYTLTRAHRSQAAARSQFSPDTQVDLSLQTNTSTYNAHTGDTCSWYDAGHLAPDDDFRFSASAEADAMVFTNVAPQQANFNEAAWRTVENAVRKLCDQYGDVKVWTGVSYSGGKKVNGIPKPAYYWKVVIYNGGKIEWLGDNICKKGRKEKDLRVPNTEIEQRTNLSFH